MLNLVGPYLIIKPLFLLLASLLPERKLKTLLQRPLNHLPETKDGYSLLLFWYWEDCLKQRYAFIKALVVCKWMLLLALTSPHTSSFIRIFIYTCGYAISKLKVFKKQVLETQVVMCEDLSSLMRTADCKERRKERKPFTKGCV